MRISTVDMGSFQAEKIIISTFMEVVINASAHQRLVTAFTQVWDLNKRLYRAFKLFELLH